jgi:hypothetical protein
MRKPGLTILLSMLAVFISGAVVGAFGHRLYSARTVSAARAQPPRRTPEEWRRNYVQTLQKRLALRDDQVTGLNTILDDTRDMYKSAKDRNQAEMKQIHEGQVSKIRGMLDPAQQTKYDEFRAERERERKKREENKSSGL